jgi:hypothetical protein
MHIVAMYVNIPLRKRHERRPIPRRIAFGKEREKTLSQRARGKRQA